MDLRTIGIHALPIHDAVMVGRAWVDMSKELMEQVFLDMTNVGLWLGALSSIRFL